MKSTVEVDRAVAAVTNLDPLATEKRRQLVELAARQVLAGENERERWPAWLVDPQIIAFQPGWVGAARPSEIG